MKLSQTLYARAEKIWPRYLSHPFVTQMADGTLPPEKFRYYMLQDYLYLKDYVKIFAAIIQKADDFEQIRFLSEELADTIGETFRTHIPYMKRLGITEEEIRSARTHIDNNAYTHYMLWEAQAGDVLTGLVTLLNCSWSYAYVAEKIVERCPDALWDEHYGSWFAGYVSESYRRTNQMLIDRIDGLIAFAGSEDGKKIFGAEKAAGIEAHAKKIKAEGARFCDCPACTAVAAILTDKEDLYAPTYSLTWTVTDEMTAKRIGSAGSKILSTPNMVALMEDAALELAKSYLEEGQTTVGAEIHCRHLAPTPVGMKVTATAKLRSIERRKLWFDIEVHDEKGKCGEGSHLRIIVNSKAMSEKAEKKAE